MQTTAKEKLRSYAFSKVDEDDSIDNSQHKDGDEKKAEEEKKMAEELFYFQW